MLLALPVVLEILPLPESSKVVSQVRNACRLDTGENCVSQWFTRASPVSLGGSGSCCRLAPRRLTYGLERTCECMLASNMHLTARENDVERRHGK